MPDCPWSQLAPDGNTVESGTRNRPTKPVMTAKGDGHATSRSSLVPANDRGSSNHCLASTTGDRESAHIPMTIEYSEILTVSYREDAQYGCKIEREKAIVGHGGRFDGNQLADERVKTMSRYLVDRGLTVDRISFLHGFRNQRTHQTDREFKSRTLVAFFHAVLGKRPNLCGHVERAKVALEPA